MKVHEHLNYLQQLVAVDAATAIYIIQFEVPAELLLHSTFQHQAQSSHILHKVNVTILQKTKTKQKLKKFPYKKLNCWIKTFFLPILSNYTSKKDPTMQSYLLNRHVFAESNLFPVGEHTLLPVHMYVKRGWGQLRKKCPRDKPPPLKDWADFYQQK